MDSDSDFTSSAESNLQQEHANDVAGPSSAIQVGSSGQDNAEVVQPHEPRVTGFREVVDENGQVSYEFKHSDSEDSDDPDFVPPSQSEDVAGGSTSRRRPFFRSRRIVSSDSSSDGVATANRVARRNVDLASSDSENETVFRGIPVRGDTLASMPTAFFYETATRYYASSADEMDITMSASEDDGRVETVSQPARVQRRRRAPRKKVQRKKIVNLTPLPPKTIRRKIDPPNATRYLKNISDDCLKQKCNIVFDYQVNGQTLGHEVEYRIGSASLTILNSDEDSSFTNETIREVLPKIVEIRLFISMVPTRSVLMLKFENVVDEDEAARIPKPSSMKMNEFRRRKLNYIDETRKFYNVELNQIPPEVVQGIANKSLFRLELTGFDDQSALLEFDVILLSSAVDLQHEISNMPTKRSKPVTLALEFFLGLDSAERYFADEKKTKEDIDWFYGQIRKYHQLESLPQPQFSMQHSSVSPYLREYQRKAVHWMLHREGALPESDEPTTNLLESFLGIMYVPVSLSRKDTGAIEPAFYNPFTGYLCLERPELASIQSGGILADEMGLGKTVEVLSLILLNQRNLSDEFKIEPEDENVSDSDADMEEGKPQMKRKSDTSNRPITDKDSDDDSRMQLVHPSLRKKRCISPCEFEANICTEIVEPGSPVENLQDEKMDVEEEQEQDAELVGNCNYATGSDNLKPKRRGAKKPKRRGAKRNWSKVKPKKLKSSKVKTIVEKGEVALSKKESTYDRVKWMYDAALGSYSESKNANLKPKFHGEFFNPNIGARAFFECVCGSQGDIGNEGSASCVRCSSSQHLACVGLSGVTNIKKVLKTYLCPHCAAGAAPLEAKTTLIISPSTISHQWINEIQRHVKNHRLKILLYKGVSKHGYIPSSKLAEYDIVITTYHVLSKEIDYVDLPHSNSLEGRRYRNPKRYATIPSPLPSVQWWRLCLDEAQMVESSSTKMATMALTLKAVHRWCITGTPINKGLDDLYGLIAFLGISPINEEYWWNCLVRSAFYRKETKLLFELFGQLIWRSGKADVLDQLGIPPQSQVVHWLNFSPVETHFYKRHHAMCSTRILEKITRISQTMPHAIDMKLSELDRQTLHGLLIPFLELRQACCHPQMVKGHSFAINKLTGTLTMEQLLTQLIQKTVVQCAEDHRLIIASLNGAAGIHIILEQFPEASDKYREVLQLARKHENRFSTDTLQLLHTLENLADIVDRNYPGVAFTLRDDDLRTDAEELKDKYLQRHADGVKEANISAERTTQAVEALRTKFQCTRQTWWISVLDRAAKIQKIEDLVSRLKDDLIVYASKRKHSGSLANKFSDASGLEHNLVQNIAEMESLRETILDALADIQNQDPHSFVNEAVACHIGKGNIDFCKSNAGTGYLCRLCRNLETFYKYESILYTEQEKKEKIDRTGRNYQKKKLTGNLSRMTEEEERLTLMKEQEELLETTEHVNLGMVTHGSASWRDSDTEKALKQLLTFGKLNGCGEMVIQDGNNHMKLFQAMKTEFKLFRVLWSQIYDRISAIDELNQATTRLRLRTEHDRSTARTIPKNLKSLASGIEARERKIANINVLEAHELEPKLREMELECVSAKSDFNVHMGQVLYLESLEKKGYGKKGSSNSEECPICQIKLGNEWCVLLCGHSFCAECVKKMCVNQQQQSFLCPLCRQSIKVDEVSFVDTTVEVEAVDTSVPRESRRVRGSHSAKVAGIVDQLLKLQDTEPGEKVLIFSTWSDILGIIGKALEENDIKYCTLTSNGKAFQTNLDRFKKRDDIQVLLMPITSGSKGLNIIEATHVFLVEPILNLASELQAIGRVHRIGQTKPTFVHRFYIKNTIEEQLYEVLKTQDVSNDEETLTIADLRNLVSK